VHAHGVKQPAMELGSPPGLMSALLGYGWRPTGLLSRVMAKEAS